MPIIRIASANLEWMNDWFTSDSQPAAFKNAFSRDGYNNSTAITAQRVARLISAIDPDILAIQEGPSRSEELDLFIRTYLYDGGTPRYQFFLGDSGGAQKLALLYKPQSVNSALLTPHPEIADLIDEWLADVDGTMVLSDYRFTRAPLVVDLKLGTHTLRVIVMHTKSNFVNNGQALWQNPADRQNYVALALKARRRNATEGMHLRQYLDQTLAADPSAAIMVMGDFNDGPGLDYFEKNYLAHNVTDIVVGSAFEPEWIFAHAQHDVSSSQRYTAVFDDFVENINGKKLLLDHILLSPGLSGAGGLSRIVQSGTIHHAEYLAQVDNNGAHREDRPSDHRPVSVQLSY
jgi:endonuclease/exonuclease/phosphatase family metal-dependent hydrolase